MQTNENPNIANNISANISTKSFVADFTLHMNTSHKFFMYISYKFHSFIRSNQVRVITQPMKASGKTNTRPSNTLIVVNT